MGLRSPPKVEILGSPKTELQEHQNKGSDRYLPRSQFRSVSTDCIGRSSNVDPCWVVYYSPLVETRTYPTRNYIRASGFGLRAFRMVLELSPDTMPEFLSSWQAAFYMA